MMAILILALAIITSFMQFRISEEEVYERFEKSGIPIEMSEYRVEGRKIRYYQTGKEIQGENPIIVFVHGAPGSSQDYLGFLEDEELRKDFCLISVDRPGYGYSNFGHSMNSIEGQGMILGKLLEKIDPNRKMVLVGHSFGGPVVAAMAAQLPEKVDQIVLLAPALDPKHEKYIGLARFCKIPPIWWLTPIAWKVAADEKTSHVKELEKMDPNWEGIKCQVIHMHGTEDSLVPYQNVGISKERMINAQVEVVSLEGADHFLPWSHFQEIKNVLISLL